MSQAFISKQTVRIGEINYGGHLGHDSLLTLLHQARLEFLAHLGASEIHFFGAGLIMRQLQVDYLGEAFLNDELSIEIRLKACAKVRFTLDYQVFCKEQCIAKATTQMVAFDYQARKVVAIDPQFYLQGAPYVAE